MKTCKVDKCYKKKSVNGFCRRHYDHIRLHGKILKRTRFDPNDFMFEDNICKIHLYDYHGNKITEAIIDKEDYKKIKNRKRHISKGGYVVDNNKIILSRFLIDLNDNNYFVDHINMNVLDNRKCNLRICTNSKNQMNRGKQNNNTSGFKGASWHKMHNKWRSTIQKNRKQIHLGYFNTKNEAAKAYNVAAIKYHDEFAKLNQIIRAKDIKLGK